MIHHRGGVSKANLGDFPEPRRTGPPQAPIKCVFCLRIRYGFRLNIVHRHTKNRACRGDVQDLSVSPWLHGGLWGWRRPGDCALSIEDHSRIYATGKQRSACQVSRACLLEYVLVRKGRKKKKLKKEHRRETEEKQKRDRKARTRCAGLRRLWEEGGAIDRPVSGDRPLIVLFEGP